MRVNHQEHSAVHLGLETPLNHYCPLRTKSSEKTYRTVSQGLLLMEEILHHLGCIKAGK